MTDAYDKAGLKHCDRADFNGCVDVCRNSNEIQRVRDHVFELVLPNDDSIAIENALIRAVQFYDKKKDAMTCAATYVALKDFQQTGADND